MPLPRRRSRRAAAAAAKAAIAARSKKPVVIRKKKKQNKKHPPPTKKPVSAAVAKKKKSKNPPAKKKSAPITPTKKTKLTGLAHAVLDTSKTLGVVDPEANLPPGQSSIANLDNHPCDVMLSLINPAQNSDKFFILQLIRTNENNNNNNTRKNNNNNKWIVYTRWGRTGTTGQALKQDFTDAATAQKVFMQKFKQKTGRTWADRSEPSLNGKYRFVEQDYTQKVSGFNGATWQYWVDDGVDGKTPGWYEYTRDASKNVERLHSEHTRNADFSQRWVSSGHFTYNVNLTTMMQTNVTHANRKSRHIRRCPAGVAMSREPPTPATTV